jgi:gamma-glutamyltranspeptidase/glutathione hydrolase
LERTVPVPSFAYEFPYGSKKLPIFAANVVASSQHLAATAGLRMLARGGNAVDAAIAAAIAITVVEPTMNGIGADAFCILWDGTKLVGLNASGHSPALMTPDRYTGKTQMPNTGWDCVTVPGAVSLWVELHKRYGKLPFADLFEPGIQYARDGFRVSYMVSRQWDRAITRLKGQPSWLAAFLPNGRAPQPGEIWKFPAQAETLAKIAASNGESFYRGELAEAMDRYAQATGGALRKADLAAHKPDWVDPIGLTYRGTTLHEIPPSGQGIAACMALGILENFDIAGHENDGPEVAHLRIEAMKLAFADIHKYVADPRFMQVTPAQLLDKTYLKSRAKLIDPRKAQNFGPGVPKQSGTIYLGAADASGMMVSLIQSNYTGFGSGIVVPGTGIALQNRGTGFSLEPGHANFVGPNKRPFHTIIPGFITKDGRPVATFGLMGGGMQPQGHMQVFSRIVDYGQNPQAAIDGPRWRLHESDGTVWTESHMPDSTLTGLESRGHKITRTTWPSFDFGSSQIIWRFPEGGPYLGASESRRDGAAVGF